MARILWLPPGLLQGSTRSFTPTCAGHSVPTGVRCTPATTQGPLLRRHYPPSSLLRAHARVLWPPCPFDLGLVGTGLRRLCHPRLVHRTVLALTAWLLPKVSCPVRRVLAWCLWSVSSQATTAFASNGRLGALP